MALTPEQLRKWVDSLADEAFKAVSEAVDARRMADSGKVQNFRTKLTQAVAGLEVADITAGLQKDTRAGGTMLRGIYNILESDLDGSDPDVTINIKDHLIADKNVPKILTDCDEQLFVQCVQAVTMRLRKEKRKRANGGTESLSDATALSLGAA